MEPHHGQEGIDGYAAWLVRRKARQLIGTAGFTESDREDLEQEMRLDLITRLPGFDRDKGTPKTFVARILEHKVSTLIRYRTQEMRDYRRQGCPRHAEIGDGEVRDRGETVAQEAWRLGKQCRTRREQGELALDVAGILSRLPDDLRRLCRLLQTGTLSEAAHRTGIPRTTLNDHVLRLRRRFEEAALGDYL